MKKLYFMLAAMVFAVAGYLSPQVMASKTVYFANTDNWSIVKCHHWGGNNGSSGNGNDMTSTEKTYKGATVYSYDLPDDCTGFNFNKNDWGNGKQTGNLSIVENGLYVWPKGTTNEQPTITGITNWSYDAVSVSAPATMYMFGNINGSGDDGWNKKDTNGAAKQSGDVYKWENFEFSQGSWFRFNDGSSQYSTNQDSDYGVSDGATDVQTKEKSVNAFQINAGTYNITLKWNNGSPLLTVQKATDPVGPITDYWLRGKFTDWGTNDTYKFTPDAKGEVYTLKVNNGKLLCDNSSDTSDNFGFKVGAAGSSDWESYSTGNSSMELNTLYTDMTSGNNMKLKSGSLAENQEVTVIFNKKNKTIIFKTDPVVTNSWKFVYSIGGNEIELPFDDNNQITGFDKFKNLTSVNQTGTYYFYVKYGSTKYGVKNGIWINGDNHTSEHLIANGSNVNYNFQGDNGKSKSYTINWNPSTHTISFVAEADYAYDTFYFNMMHNEDNKNGVKEVKLMLLERPISAFPSGLWDADIVRDLTLRTDAQGARMYSYKFTEAELGKYKNAAVYITDDDNQHHWFVCRANADQSMSNEEHPKNGWNHVDAGGNNENNWLKYVYVASGKGLAAQSYITYDEWQKRLVENKNTVYFTGEGVDGLSWNPEIENIESADGVDGVVYWTNKTSSDIYFKISWLKPYDQWVKSGKSGGSIDNQRAWATFNMGIIAFDKVKGKDYFDHESDETNDNIVVKLNKILPYNRKSAENWKIRGGDGAADGTKVLVLDSHSECKTVALLTFEPNPQLNVEAGSIVDTDLTPDDAAKLHDVQVADSHVFHGEKTNGLAHITSLNTLSAKATLVAKYAELTTNGANMTVKYNFYANGDVIYTTGGEDPNNEEFKFANIAVGDGSTVGARGLYFDNDTKCQFHSKFANGTLSGDFKAQSPVIQSIGTKGYAVMSDAPETLSAMFAANVTLPTNGVVYPDFEVKVNENSSNNYHLSAPEKANGGEIVHRNHAVAKQYTWFDKVAYTPATSASDYDHDTHNWTVKLGADNAAWPLYLPDVLKLANDDNHKWYGESGDMNTTLDFTAYAVYPFLIDRKATVTVTTKSNAPRRAAANLDFSDAHDYHIVLVRIPASTTVELDEKSPLTGIDDIVAPEADAEAVYYTLDGRLAGSNPAAGVYIRRVGNKAEKVYIR